VTDADRLFSEHRDGVFRYVRRIVGQPEAARDLTQEVFLRVARAGVPDTAGEGRRAWIFRIARNLALNHVRDHRRRPQSVAIEDRSAPATQELSEAIRQALAALPEIDRDVFLLREQAGLPYDEIAASCGLTTDAVRSRLHRTRQQLRDALGPTLDVHRQRGVRLAKREPW